ncbi:MAG: phosphate ABC transporter permease subunit PstC [Chloroflexota bacterium]
MSSIPAARAAPRAQALPGFLRRAVKSTTGLRGDVAFRALTLLSGLLVLVAVVGILGTLLIQSRLSFAAFGWNFLGGQTWDPVAKQFGALTFVFGTVVTSAVAVALAAPFGLAVALFLTEMAPRRLRVPLAFGAELLAAIPSVVYGLWGIFVLAPFLRSVVEPALGRFSFLPIFSGPPYGVGLLAGGCIIAIMIVPTIVAISRDVIAAVPQAQREAAYALGATQWEVITSAIVPFGASGIIGAVMLALGRAVGETMAVTMVIGNSHTIQASLFGLGDTMSSVLANEFTEAAYPLYVSALIEIGLVLFGVTVLLNIGARLLVWRVTRANGA